jgi:hypothetical protein
MQHRRYVVRWLRGHWAVLRNADASPVSFHDRKLDAVSVASALAAKDDVPLVVEDGEDVHPPSSTRREH